MTPPRDPDVAPRGPRPPRSGRTRERIVTMGLVALGLFWLGAAGAKIAKPQTTYEFAAHLSPPGWSPKSVLTGVIALEAALGTAMVLRAVRSAWPSLLALLGMSAALVLGRARFGPQFPCGCFGDLFGATIDDALLRNACLAALHAALLLAARRPAQR